MISVVEDYDVSMRDRKKRRLTGEKHNDDHILGRDVVERLVAVPTPSAYARASNAQRPR